MPNLSKEIDGMIGSFLSGEQTPSETPAETPVETPSETPSETSSETPTETPSDAPSETPTETPAETPSETPTETPVETPSEEPELEEETAEQLRERLQKTIDFYEGRGGQVPAPTPTTDSKPAAEPEPTPQLQPKEITLEPVTFVRPEDVADMSDDPEKLATFLNVMMNKVRLDAVQQAIPLAQERTMLSVPQVTAQYIKRHNAMKALVDDFYDKNKDLKVVQRSVGMIANEVHAENPDWTVQKVFDEAATRTRAALGLKTPVAGAKPDQGTKPADNPAFANPSQSRARGAQKKLSGMAKEIDDLIS